MSGGAPPWYAARSLAALAAIGALGLFMALDVRVLGHAGALWRDEINSVNTQRTPTLAAMWRLEEFESFPLLWSLLLRAWIALTGDGDPALRLFGVLMLLTVPAAVWHAGRRAGAGLPAASLALLAVSPTLLRWGATVRPWGFGAALGLEALVWIQATLDTPSPGTIAAAAVVTILAVQCLYQNAVIVAAGLAGAGAIALRQRSWRRLVVPAGLAAGAAASLLPYAGLVERRAAWNLLGRAPLGAADIVTRAGAAIGASGGLVDAGWVALAAGATAIVVRGARHRRPAASPGRTDVAVYWIVAAGAAAFGLLVFYDVLGYVPNAWYFLGAIVLLPVAAEIAIGSLGAAAARRGLAALGVAVLIAGAGGVWRSLGVPNTNVDGIAARVAAGAGPGDLVVVNPWFVAITFDRYYRGAAGLRTVPPLDDHAVHRYDLVKTLMTAADPITPLLDELRTTLEGGHRVWYVGPIDVPAPGSIVPSLGRPPRPATGWWVVPYQDVWSLEVGTFLYAHARQAHRDVADDADDAPFERTTLTEISGWR